MKTKLEAMHFTNVRFADVVVFFMKRNQGE